LFHLLLGEQADALTVAVNHLVATAAAEALHLDAMTISHTLDYLDLFHRPVLLVIPFL
jgi:hypothetical protein